MATTPTPDPLTALAAELGRIGQRLDGMSVELMTLRDGMGAADRPSSPEGRTVAHHFSFRESATTLTSNNRCVRSPSRST